MPGFREGVALGVGPGGGILVAGEDGYDEDAALVKFGAAGILDPSYGGGGHVELPGVDGVNAMALDRSGGAAVLSQRTDLTRVTGAGAIDTGFGEDGTVSLPTLALSFSEFHFWAVAILPDDDVLVAGISFGSPRMVVLRLLPDGALDPSFGDDGLATVGLAANPNAGAFAMATLQDGDILLGGYAHHELALARLLPDGSPDPGFGEDGLSTARGITGQATALAPRPDGSVLAVGYGVRHDQRENLLLRLGSTAPSTPPSARWPTACPNAGATRRRSRCCRATATPSSRPSATVLPFASTVAAVAKAAGRAASRASPVTGSSGRRRPSTITTCSSSGPRNTNRPVASSGSSASAC